ncbi:sensor histidine kinase [Flavihumibacter stibioxidans]|uniref:Histidine kinase n=1 Tax=Flavihumibacter stibioxidans TaxID=1834163 RepID=A0ABR7M9R7_9BACT|nr:histidine kinase [Flavihumibacter stibioxidans]MBC6491681.1 histidine kinase [Flavihumibacter stibioxidans]
MSKNLFSRKWLMVLLQVVAWILLFSLPFLLRPGQHQPAGKPESSSGVSLFYVVNNLFWVLLFYLNAMVFIPRVLYKRKFPAYVLTLVLLFIIYLAIGWINSIWLRDSDHFSMRIHILVTFFIFIFTLATSTAIRMGIDRIRADKLADEKENENLKTELSLLRSQVSPHFMFNVLNNMVALARKKSDLLEPSLIKLSSLMRYMLYDVEGEKVSLEKEIEYLESYIDLQKQRISKNIFIHSDFSDVDRSYEIEPMLLIPFVENAFKHGTGLVENAGIDIVLSAKNNRLQFNVRNRYSEESFEIKDKTSGIGLANVKRRLNLLYGKNHSLDVDKKDGWFTVTLNIILS